MWTRFVRKGIHKEGFDMVLIEADEKAAIEIFKFMFKEYDEYFLYYSVPPSIENTEFYTIEGLTVRVFSADELDSLKPTECHKVY